MEATSSVETRSDFTRFIATFIYAVIVAAGVAIVFAKTTSPGGARQMMSIDLDIWLFAGITVAGIALRYFFAAYSEAVKVIACLGGFLIFTIGHDPMTRYLTLSALLFAIGMYGMVKSRNAVRVLMSIELMLNAVNINLITFARYVDPAGVKGHLFAIFILTVAAAEAAVGLAIVLSIYRNLATVDMDRFNLLRW